MDNQFNDNDINKDMSVASKNKNEFNSVMSNAAVKKDDYLDSNNKSVKIILLILGIFIVIGISYYLILWFTK